MKAANLLAVKDAAQLLGVRVPTLRRWGRLGWCRAKRLPINGHKLYRHADLLQLKTKIQHGRAA